MSEAGAAECARCGLIFEKWKQRPVPAAPRQEGSTLPAAESSRSQTPVLYSIVLLAAAALMFHKNSARSRAPETPADPGAASAPAGGGCRLRYRIGQIDPVFHVSKEELKEAAKTGGRVWEEAAQRPIFAYDEGAPFTINLVFDERHTLGGNESFQLEANKLVADSLRQQMDDRRAAYDARVAAYTRDLDRFNQNMQTRSGEYDHLVREQAALQSAIDSKRKPSQAEYDRFNQDDERYQQSLQSDEQERNRLQSEQLGLRSMVNDINSIAAANNDLAGRVNTEIKSYHEDFNKGLYLGVCYRGSKIDIFAFRDKFILAQVLAHEMGHAIGLDHGRETASVMAPNHDATQRLEASVEDKEALAAVCGRK